MNITKMRAILSFVAVLATALTMSAQVYICGSFNGWNPKEPLTMIRQADGVYTATIDFSSGPEFKISTVKGQNGNGWSDFDTGTLYYEGVPTANMWIGLTQTPASSNCIAPSQSTYTVSVDLDNLRIKFGDGTATTAYSGTLPVMFINTAGNAPITSKETYVDANYWIDPMGVEGVEAIGSEDAPLTTQIRGRGNYTWIGFDKKPYRVKLTDKQPLLGMPKSKHWALLAHADDRYGFMRNFAGMTASESLEMPWTPQSQPCEVVLNGNYIGLYFLTQTVRVDKDRVDVVEQLDLATTDVDGGWLV